jgi:hypothetical protein
MKKYLLLLITSTTLLTTRAQPGNPFTPLVSLPVLLTSFTGTEQNGSAHLHWQTAQEINSSSFDIEHSCDGAVWTNAGSVKAAGNNTFTSNYSFTHTLPVQGKNYYRLKLVDMDASWELSQAIVITINEIAGIRIYPVPVSNFLVIELSAFQEGIPYTIVNTKGKEVKRGIIRQNNQRISVQDLAVGLYYFRTNKFKPVKFMK